MMYRLFIAILVVESVGLFGKSDHICHDALLIKNVTFN